MKHILPSIAALVLLAFTGCSQAILPSDEWADATGAAVVPEQDSLVALLEQARQGDGHAYLLLARRHHDGNGVERDFLKAWVMAQMAAQYGAIDRSEHFFTRLPSGDPDRMMFEAMDGLSGDRCADALRKADSLSAQHPAYATFLRAGVAMAQGRTGESMGLFRQAADEGLSMANLVIALAEGGRDAAFDHAELLPTLYCRMARQCLSADPDPLNDERAAYYYRLADAHLCLDDIGVRWMHDYCEQRAREGVGAADSTELKRLRLLVKKLHSKNG